MNTTEPRLLRVEIVADLPVLWTTIERLELPATLDRHFPTPQNWKGPLTPGEVLAVWLLFILSQGDHCLNHVEPWIAEHQSTQGLRISLGCLGVLGNCDSPLLSSPAGRVSDGFCSIDHLEISTSSGMSTRGPSAQTRPP